jgi:hypothetical protein
LRQEHLFSRLSIEILETRTSLLTAIHRNT